MAPDGRERDPQASDHSASDRSVSDLPRSLRRRRAAAPPPLTPPAARAPAASRKRDLLLVATGAGIVAVLGALTLWTLDASRSGSEAGGKPVPMPLGAAETALPPLVQTPLPLDLATAPPPGTAFDPLTGQPVSGQPVTAAPLSAPAPQPVLAAPPETAAPAARGALDEAKPRSRYGSPALVFDAGEGQDAAADAAAPRTAAARARMLTRGTLIPAVLETAIDAGKPGYVRAVVSTDIRSADGRRVLVERSSRLLGQYRARAGDRRAYVVWTRIARPGGGAVALAAPGGEFFAGFANASLMSIVSGAPGGGAARVRPGEPIRVFAGKDLDL